MILIITNHGRRRMTERGIDERQIREILVDPDLSWPGDGGGQCYRRRCSNGRILKVWLAAPMASTGDSVIVKSTAWQEEE